MSISTRVNPDGSIDLSWPSTPGSSFTIVEVLSPRPRWDIEGVRPSVRRCFRRAMRRLRDPYSYPPPATAWRWRKGRGRR